MASQNDQTAVASFIIHEIVFHDILFKRFKKFNLRLRGAEESS